MVHHEDGGKEPTKGGDLKALMAGLGGQHTEPLTNNEGGGEIAGYGGTELTAYGGRRRRGKRGSKRRGSKKSNKGSRKNGHNKKTRKGKRSAWITHVLNFSKQNNMKYPQALKDKRCRATYKKM